MNYHHMCNRLYHLLQCWTPLHVSFIYGSDLIRHSQHQGAQKVILSCAFNHLLEYERASTCRMMRKWDEKWSRHTWCTQYSILIPVDREAIADAVWNNSLSEQCYTKGACVFSFGVYKRWWIPQSTATFIVCTILPCVTYFNTLMFNAWCGS